MRPTGITIPVQEKRSTQLYSSLKVEEDTVPDVDHPLGLNFHSFADLSKKVGVLHAPVVRRSRKYTFEGAGKTYKLNLEELPYGVGGDDEPVPLTQAGQDTGNLGERIACVPPLLQETAPVAV